MNRIAAYWIALGACVVAVGLYSVAPTLRSLFETKSRPTPDTVVSLAVLADVSSLSASTPAVAPQNENTAPADTTLTDTTLSGTANNLPINDIPQVVVLPPQSDASTAPAMAPAQVLPLPTITPTPVIEQPTPIVEPPAQTPTQVPPPTPSEPTPDPNAVAQPIVTDPNPVIEQSLVAPPPIAETFEQRTDPAPAAPALTDGCWVEAPPASLGLDSYYAKYCSAHGIPIVASIAVPDAALQRAWQIVTTMLDGLPQGEAIRASIISRAARVGIIGQHQATTDLPEHRSLYTLFPSVDWNNRARGVGATPEIPLLSVAEENLLCYPGDLWVGQNVLVHEFAHTIKNLGLDYVNPNFHVQLERIYQQALDAGLWANTYVISDIEEYWAEGVRLYFQIEEGGAPGGQFYPANSRAGLQSYDPELFRIVESIFGPRSGIPLCP